MRTSACVPMLLVVLVLSGCAIPGTQTSELSGTAWKLVKIMSMDDSVYVPQPDTTYSLVLGADGQATIQADCNRGSGPWSSGDMGRLTMGPIASTRAMCAPGSFSDRYLKNMEFVRSYVIENGNLFLATMADGSIIEFQPLDSESGG